ncbi:ERMES complex subunit mmm1, partial [Quaeritorhiza haematococci]
IALEFVNDQHSPHAYIAFSILEDFLLEFEVRSLLGHRTKVKDLPKLTQLITSKLRSVFIEEIVWPSFKRWDTPTGWEDAREEKDEMEDMNSL